MNSYKELIVWQKSMDLVAIVYRFTESFPKSELYGLVMQMRRCAISIPSNIAEGWSRKNTGEYTNFLSISKGSAAELETQLLLSESLNFGESVLREQCLSLLLEVQKMLFFSVRTLQKNAR